MKPARKRAIRTVAWIGITLLVVVLAFVIGRTTGASRTTHVHDPSAVEGSGSGAAQVYTCSMHPNVRSPNPNDKCPICGMELIPVPSDDAEENDGDLPRLRLSPRAVALMNVQTWPAERRAIEVPVRLFGRIEADETRLRTISAWVPGRLDRLHVDSTGVEIKPGDPMIEIYSPRLIAAQEELLQARRGAEEMQRSGLAMIREASESTLSASREKLRLLGLTPAQIEEIERSGEVTDHLVIHAPVGGVVTERLATQGAYVETGDPIYRMADLSQVWVNLEIYESDLPWLRLGQEAVFTTEAYPGEPFTAEIVFINPVLNQSTRTVRVRLEVPNADGRLKPGMFVRGTVHARLGVSRPGSGHPEHQRHDDELPLVIPASAPLLTGRRAVVYVRLPDMERPTFEPRNVVLGPRAGDVYVVREGLEEGERVVTHGGFKIDSELQIRGRPSMMAPDGEAPPAHDHAHGSTDPIRERAPALEVTTAFLEALGPVYRHYLEAQTRLAGDDLAGFTHAAEQMHQAVQAVPTDDLSRVARSVWSGLARRLRTQQEQVSQLTDIKAARLLFETYSMAALELLYRFSYPGDDELVVAFCPMAMDDAGGHWLQVDGQIANPYFGASMLRCGWVVERPKGREVER
jgi:membrane fusion protein, copper/silver efflux system